MIQSSSNLHSILNLPKEIFQANQNLNQKLIGIAVEEKVAEATSPQRLLDVYC
ncbi:hypothetical protein [Leptospira ryugenii]|uniref:hypothetical protein n=1 Tax=Leptospira ryugenii TaxID=1917863 RepID=UPI001435677B|nr:hypothetical protein [Leptospira ryugenii]